MATLVAKSLRFVYLFLAYTLGLIASLWLAYQLRFDFHIPAEHQTNWLWIFGGMIGVKLLLLHRFGQFGSLLSYFGFQDLGKILLASTVAAGLALLSWQFYGARFAPPRAVIVTDLLTSFLFLNGFRLSLRLFREGYFRRNGNDLTQRRIAILGAGDVGASLARELLARRGLGMTPVAFFDDERKKWGTSIHGITVEGHPNTLADYLQREKLDEVIIAMPGASGRRVRELVTLLNRLRLRFEIVPSYEQLIKGQVRVSQIRPVEIQDLLGRPAVNLQADLIRELIRDRVVLVTGAGGSIGGELCRQIARSSPRLLLLVERSEFLLFQIEQELIAVGTGTTLIPLVADITNEERMRGILQKHAPDIIFHAAAHKHVPMMEQQPVEAFRNNTLGTRNLAHLAIEFGVQRFIFISTDKAINPTNVMGATKRMAELYLQALQATTTHTQFMAVRFGNVLGSSGSVIPTFNRQIAAGGPVTVTHPDVTRYFMTVSEAVGLVLQTATIGEGGAIFVLDMGEPMKIVDLAHQLIELSGLEPGVDIEIKFTGLRLGEKMYEELSHTLENTTPTSHSKIMRMRCTPLPLSQVEAHLARLADQADHVSHEAFKTAIKAIVPEYQPYLHSS